MAVFRKETRKPRHPTQDHAWMMLDGGFAKRDCVVLNLSQGGARIRLTKNEPVAGHLRLALTKDVRKLTHCRLVWRKDTTIGVEFVGRT